MEYVSESLLASIDKVDTRDIDLCDPRWRVAPQGWFSDEEELEPEKKKLKQTLDRGRFHRITEKELDSLVVAKPPVNTEYSTKWAVRNFNDWKHQRNATCSSESKAIPDDLLESGSVHQLCHWLSLLIMWSKLATSKANPTHRRPFTNCSLDSIVTPQ